MLHVTRTHGYAGPCAGPTACVITLPEEPIKQFGKKSQLALTADAHIDQPAESHA